MPRKLLLILLPLLSFGIGGCDSGHHVVPITERRELSPDDRELAMDATSKQRFAMVNQMMGMEEDHSGHDHAEDAPLVYELPEGWKKEPTSQFRTLNFSFGEQGEGECYVSRAGGGLEANLNRWRGQMGLEAAPEEELRALPKRTLFGMEATYAEFDGDFKAVGASDSKPGYRMVGLVLSLPDVSFFVKMTGPKELVVANEEQFSKFCESLKLTRGGQHE